MNGLCIWKNSEKWVLIYLFLFAFLLIFCLKQGYWQDGEEGSDFTVKVPIQQVMSGKPIQLPQDDKRIINYIWDMKLMEPPSKIDYNLKMPNENPSMGQGQYIQQIFQNKTNGFFIESGALDGETRSNTLFLEKNLGWKGLLVEADPSNYALVKTKNRKAWTSNTCLLIKPYPHQTDFMQSFNVGKILSPEASGVNRKKVVTVQCMPLFSLLTAIGVTTVDYFSLDVEGSELQVLKTIPFDKVFIKTLSVEFKHTKEGKDSLRDFMESKGYKMIHEITHPGDLANDFIFVHSTVIDYVN